LLTLKKI
jgi:hypothetical protein